MNGKEEVSSKDTFAMAKSTVTLISTESYLSRSLPYELDTNVTEVLRCLSYQVVVGRESFAACGRRKDAWSRNGNSEKRLR